MKITCRLISRDSTLKCITEVELERTSFAFNANNPFPASEFFTGSFYRDSMLLTYRVNEAFGDNGSAYLAEDRAA